MKVEKWFCEIWLKFNCRGVRHVLFACRYARATALLTQHKGELHKLAAALVEHETLTSDEIKTVTRGGKLDRPL